VAGTRRAATATRASAPTSRVADQQAAILVVSSNSQVGPDTISGHKPRTGDHANIIGGTVNGTDIATGGVVGRNVADDSLTGADIADRSGVDTCKPTLTVKLGPICAGSDAAGSRTWNDAVDYCAGLGLRLPSLSEALARRRTTTFRE
jgi:hypothetical protein